MSPSVQLNNIKDIRVAKSPNLNNQVASLIQMEQVIWRNMQMFEKEQESVSGSILIPDWTVAIAILMYGGGAGGDGYSASAKGGGSAEIAYYVYNLTNLPKDTKLNYSTGAGGAGGASGTKGSPGGDTTISFLEHTAKARGGVSSQSKDYKGLSGSISPDDRICDKLLLSRGTVLATVPGTSYGAEGNYGGGGAAANTSSPNRTGGRGGHGRVRIVFWGNLK